MTKKEVHEILMRAFVQWPHMTVTVPMTELWFEAFKSYPIDQFRMAMTAALKNSHKGFPPTIGEVNYILSQMTNLPEDRLTEGEAYRIIINAVQRFGSYQGTQALDYLKSINPRLEQCAKIMGWKDICAWQTDDEPANRAHLWRVYLGIKERDTIDDTIGQERISIDKDIYKLLNGPLLKTIPHDLSKKE